MKSAALPYVVLGGGACGMSAALELAKLGKRSVVLEREPRVGGLCGTVEKDGFRFDFGGHRFITRNPDIDELVRGLLGDDMLERRRSSIILNGGKRYRYPLELDDVVKQFGVARGVRALASYAGQAARQRLSAAPDRSFRDWVSNRFGGDLYKTFFGPYTGKLWGIAPEQISADWAAERISTPSLADVMLRLLHVPRPPARTHARNYRYPKLGIGQIFERCAVRLRELGTEVVTGAEVVGVAVRNQKVRAVRWRDERGGEHETACQGIVSTISLPLLAGMLGTMPGAVARAASKLRFRAIRLLNVQLEGPPVSPHTWMYVSEPRYLMSRIQEPIHRSPAMAPPGCTSLMLEVPCDVGDETWRASDRDVYERCLSDLSLLGLKGLRERTKGCFSTTVREGYPIYHLDYRADRQQVLDHVTRYQGVASSGRQGAFKYIFMDTAMELGMQAARDLVAGKMTAVGSEHNAAELYEGKVLTA